MEIIKRLTKKILLRVSGSHSVKNRSHIFGHCGHTCAVQNQLLQRKCLAGNIYQMLPFGEKHNYLEYCKEGRTFTGRTSLL